MNRIAEKYSSGPTGSACAILFTNTQFPADFILKRYREKDIVEKAFSHVKPYLEPF